MLLSAFDYHLPPELIAHEPTSERPASRLMHLVREQDHPPTHLHFWQLPSLLAPGDLLVMNDTRVFRARLFVNKPTGGRIELLFLQREPTEEGAQIWRALARSNKSLRVGANLIFPEGHGADVIGRREDGAILLRFDPALDLMALLERHGEIPLPPYIDPARAQGEHAERYQTVYARQAGAIAAPTAGLHFTQELLGELEAMGVRLAWVTLHVGAGTFLPVRTENILEHAMHEEIYQISEGAAKAWQETREAGGRVIAVGTTSLRTLEGSAALHERPIPEQRSTNLFIYPGYRFLAVDGLITNFHLPKSTLLMLVAAFHGHTRILDAYRQAVEQQYRFFSYGDAMAILPPPTSTHR